MANRPDKRAADQLRRIKIRKDYLNNPLSSVMIEFGRTRLICAVSVEHAVPQWMRNQKKSGGWLTCEYGMLPASTRERNKRDITNGRPNGRSMEIQRLIGRSLRSVVDLEALGQNTVYIDCDVIDADGGTRCAGICGASVAFQLALNSAFAKRNFSGQVMRESIAAVSVGIVNGEPVLDLNYAEDSQAEVDMNVVMTESGKIVEIQGTAERAPFSRVQFNELMDLAEHGLKQIFEIQRKVIAGEEPEKNESKKSELGRMSDAFSGINL